MGGTCVEPDGATVAKEGENCEGFNEFTGNPFPNCETGLVCKHTAEMSIPGAGKTCVKTDTPESPIQFIPVQTDVPISDNNSNLEQGPCLNLAFEYRGKSQNVQKKLRGTFSLEDSRTWVNNRVVYWNNQTRLYLYWMNKPSAKIEGEHGFWM